LGDDQRTQIWLEMESDVLVTCLHFIERGNWDFQGRKITRPGIFILITIHVGASASEYEYESDGLEELCNSKSTLIVKKNEEFRMTVSFNFFNIFLNILKVVF